MKFLREASPKRSRLRGALIVALLIMLGLASRSFDRLPGVIREHAGDALWAAMIYWGFATVFPRLAVSILTIISLTFCFGIELSQLSSHSLLVEARSHRLGALVLGHGFLWIDLLRYTGGVALAALADHFMLTKTSRQPAT